MAYSQQRQRDSNSFDYGSYHSLDSVSTSALGEEDSFSSPFFMLSSIKHPILGSEISSQFLLGLGFGFKSIDFVVSTMSQHSPCGDFWNRQLLITLFHKLFCRILSKPFLLTLRRD